MARLKKIIIIINLKKCESANDKLSAWECRRGSVKWAQMQIQMPEETRQVMQILEKGPGKFKVVASGKHWFHVKEAASRCWARVEERCRFHCTPFFVPFEFYTCACYLVQKKKRFFQRR